MTLPDQDDSSIARGSNPNAPTGPIWLATDSILLLLALPNIQSIPPSDIAVLKDSRSPKRAHRLAHRRGDNIHHPLRGLEAATGGDLGEAGGGRAGESCAAERGGHAEGHCCVWLLEGFV